MTDQHKDLIESIVQPYAQDKDIELVEVNVRPYRNMIDIQIYAYKAGGITIDECAGLNKFLCRELEESNFVDGNFTIEVSSPGLDRPLKSNKDFKRAIGANVRVHLKEKINLKLEHIGIVEGLDKENVRLLSSSGLIVLPIDSISKAVQIFNDTDE